jgi:hypothetical protein
MKNLMKPVSSIIAHRCVGRIALILGVVSLALPGRSMAAVILPNLPPGSQYQLLFVTADGRDATSSNLSVYDSFVSQEAALNPLLPATTWHAIASNTTTDALQHDVTYASIPLYNTHGQLVAHGTSDFWFPSHLAPITYDQYGILESNAEPWTGTNPNGTASNPFGNSSDGVRYAFAASYQSADWITSPNSGYNIYSGPFYGISAPITVGGVPEPSSVVLAVLGFLGFVAWGWRRRHR